MTMVIEVEKITRYFGVDELTFCVEEFGTCASNKKYVNLKKTKKGLRLVKNNPIVELYTR